MIDSISRAGAIAAVQKLMSFNCTPEDAATAVDAVGGDPEAAVTWLRDDYTRRKHYLATDESRCWIKVARRETELGPDPDPIRVRTLLGGKAVGGAMEYNLAIGLYSKEPREFPPGHVGDRGGAGLNLTVEDVEALRNTLDAFLRQVHRDRTQRWAAFGVAADDIGAHIEAVGPLGELVVHTGWVEDDGGFRPLTMEEMESDKLDPVPSSGGGGDAPRPDVHDRGGLHRSDEDGTGLHDVHEEGADHGP